MIWLIICFVTYILTRDSSITNCIVTFWWFLFQIKFQKEWPKLGSCDVYSSVMCKLSLLQYLKETDGTTAHTFLWLCSKLLTESGYFSLEPHTPLRREIIFQNFGSLGLALLDELTISNKHTRIYTRVHTHTQANWVIGLEEGFAMRTVVSFYFYKQQKSCMFSSITPSFFGWY